LPVSGPVDQTLQRNVPAVSPGEKRLNLSVFNLAPRPPAPPSLIVELRATG
jgi:hypothetical protein